MYNMNGNGIID